MICNNCGATIPEGSQFCVNCGAPVQAQPEPVYQQPVYSYEQSAPVEPSVSATSISTQPYRKRSRKNRNGYEENL